MTAAPAKDMHMGPHLRHYLELDGIRGLAALAVFIHHIGSFGMPAHSNRLLRALALLPRYGFYGVDLFFVLSGFLITSLLLQHRRSPSYFQDFYWKRVLRILPMYLVTLALVALLIPHSGSYILVSLLFVSNFASLFHVDSTGPFWSLAIEEQFYLLWPSVVRRCTARTLARVAIAVWIATILFRFLAASVGHYNYYLTPLRADGLAAGALLACWNSLRGPQAPPARQEHVLAAASFALGILLVALSSAAYTPRGVPFAAAFAATGIVFVFAACIGLAIRHAGRPWLAWLRAAPLLFFGAISYAFYLLHLYVLAAYLKLAANLPLSPTGAYFVRFATTFAATTAICLLTRYAIELPAIRLRRHVLARPTPPPEAALPLNTPTEHSDHKI